MQQFIGQGTRVSTALMIQAESLVGRWFGEADGVVIADGSGFRKDGRYLVGVARQYCGHLGKIASSTKGCQRSLSDRLTEPDRK
jgi:SRSO17 transposase